MHGEAVTKYRGNKSTSFHLAQGVRQGSILPPYLYNIYTEDIIEIIQKRNIGALLPGQINTSIIVFADDIIMLSPNLKHLQMMVNECELFGLKNGLKFNISKTQFIVSGTSPIPDVKVMFDNKSITPQMELKHLGFKWKINYRKMG